MDTRESEQERIQILILLWKWKVFILSFFVIACTSAVIFSGPAFIDPIFKSEVILFPPATNSAKQLLEYNVGFGTDKEIEEHIQILKSGILRDSISQKYQLLSHYKIDSTKQSYTDLSKLYDEKILIDRTRYNSISITVFDIDPVYAANIANDIARIGDKVKANLLNANRKAAYLSMYVDSLSANSSPKLIPNNYVPSSYIITPARISNKKVSPTRWQIVLLAAFASLLFSSLLVIAIEKTTELFSLLKNTRASNDEKR